MTELMTDWKFLERLSKVEIIDFLMCECRYHAPTEKEVDLFKWKVESDRIQKAMDDFCKDDSNIKRVEEYNKVVEEFNACKDWVRKGKMGDKLIKLQEEMKAHRNKFTKLIEQSEKIEKLFKKYH